MSHYTNCWEDIIIDLISNVVRNGSRASTKLRKFHADRDGKCARRIEVHRQSGCLEVQSKRSVGQLLARHLQKKTLGQLI